MRLYPLQDVLLAALAVGAATLGPGATDCFAQAQSMELGQDQSEWVAKISPSQTLEIKNVLGNIKALATIGDDFKVEFTKTGNRFDPKDVALKVIQDKDRITICTVYPPKPGDKPNDCQQGSKGRLRARDYKNDVRVDWYVLIPPGVKFVARTVDGRIEADLPESDVDLKNDGAISVVTNGSATLDSTDGPVVGRFGLTQAKRFINARCLGGTIDLTFPGDAKLSYELTALSKATCQFAAACFRSDFPLKFTPELEGRQATGETTEGE